MIADFLVEFVEQLLLTGLIPRDTDTAIRMEAEGQAGDPTEAAADLNAL